MPGGTVGAGNMIWGGGNVPSGFGAPASPMGMGATASADGSRTAFIVWTILLGVVLPTLLLGGLRAGGFSFVFVRR